MAQVSGTCSGKISAMISLTCFFIESTFLTLLDRSDSYAIFLEFIPKVLCLFWSFFPPPSAWWFFFRPHLWAQWFCPQLLLLCLVNLTMNFHLPARFFSFVILVCSFLISALLSTYILLSVPLFLELIKHPKHFYSKIHFKGVL